MLKVHARHYYKTWKMLYLLEPTTDTRQRNTNNWPDMRGRTNKKYNVCD